MGDLLLGLVVGFFAAVIVMSFVLFTVSRRLKLQHANETAQHQESLIDLRQERSVDKETNRQLRHDLLAQGSDRLLETTKRAEFERDAAVSERDNALQQLHVVQQDFTAASSKLVDRESKLRQYREALQEIRMSLEAQDRERANAQTVVGADVEETPGEAIAKLDAHGPAGQIELEPEPADATVNE